MMTIATKPLPDPSRTAVSLWLRTIDREHLRSAGWAHANKQFQGVMLAARGFVRDNFTTPEQQEAALDGLALGLLALAHFGDVGRLALLFEGEGIREEDSQQNQPADNNIAG